MSAHKKKENFGESKLANEIKNQLILMSKDKSFGTEDSYTSNTTKYPNNIRTFVDKHMDYLETHPTVDPELYLSNLKLASKIR